jgi:hypothetical protein
MSIFAIAIAKIDIRIKKLTALPERPIKIFLKVKPFLVSPLHRTSNFYHENPLILRILVQDNSLIKQI